MLDELASPVVAGALNEIDEVEAELRDHISRRRERLEEMRVQLPAYEAALANLRRQLLRARVRQLARRALSKIPASLQLLAQAKLENVRREERVDELTGAKPSYEANVAVRRREIQEEPARIAELERRLADYRERANGQQLSKLARSYRHDSWWPELQSIRRMSMLHPETLYLLRCCAARVRNAIVEVGPYIGGSTIALGRGIQVGGAGPLISVEMGGSYPTHAVPTDDIITDLKRNVEAYGLTGIVHIMEGFTTDPAIDAAVNRVLAGRPIDLLFLDADGNVERDFELYRGRLSRGAILVYDDYLADGAPEKQTTIKAWVDSSVASGLVENLGVYGWGTWVGRYWG
jgi:predicted O-methyltransferase YrrM